MESMALFMESAYERLYRWTQGKYNFGVYILIKKNQCTVND